MPVATPIITTVPTPSAPRPHYPWDLTDPAWWRIRGLVDSSSSSSSSSSSVKAMPVAGPRGFDGAKKIDCIKHHILLDTTGLLLAAHITPANIQDRTAFADLLTAADTATITKVRADKGYTGTAPTEAATKAGNDLEIVCGPKPIGGFVVQPRRWVVERTNGWINHHRRLVRQYETTLTAHEGFLMLSQIRLPLRRLDKEQLLDTLERDASMTRSLPQSRSLPQ
jgi:transposase